MLLTKFFLSCLIEALLPFDNGTAITYYLFVSFVIDLRIRAKVFEYFVKKQLMFPESGWLDKNMLFYEFDLDLIVPVTPFQILNSIQITVL